MSLKRKKMYEGEVAKLDGARMNLEQQIFSIEGASMTKDIFEGIHLEKSILK